VTVSSLPTHGSRSVHGFPEVSPGSGESLEIRLSVMFFTRSVVAIRSPILLLVID
jgi:hypothetical protein